MSTMRASTCEFRDSAVGLALTEEVFMRDAAEDLGMPNLALHG